MVAWRTTTYAYSHTTTLKTRLLWYREISVVNYISKSQNRTIMTPDITYQDLRRETVNVPKFAKQIKDQKQAYYDSN